MSKQVCVPKWVDLQSDYLFFELFSFKKYHSCRINIPETVLLDRNGCVKEWLFNSLRRDGEIIRKRRENLMPLRVVHALCGMPRVVNGLQSVMEVRAAVDRELRARKDYEFVKDRKVLSVVTVEGETLLCSLMMFLDWISENKLVEQSFSGKWRMIQEEISVSRMKEHYVVESVRKGGAVESKSRKIIMVGTGLNTEEEGDGANITRVSVPQAHTVTESKGVEGYKFFDSYLNKKFYLMNSQLIDHFEKNMKCTVERLVAQMVINKDREPYLVGVMELKVRPAKKLLQMREFQGGATMKTEDYLRCLNSYLSVLPVEVSIPRRSKCQGCFCAVGKVKRMGGVVKTGEKRITAIVVKGVSKRRGRVVERLKEYEVIEDYQYVETDSEDFESQGENVVNGSVKVCENCYLVYLHVIRLFDVDGHGNLVEKKVAKLRGKQRGNSLAEGEIGGDNGKGTIGEGEGTLKEQVEVNGSEDRVDLKFSKMRTPLDNGFHPHLRSILPLTFNRKFKLQQKMQSPIARIRRIASEVKLTDRKVKLNPLAHKLGSGEVISRREVRKNGVSIANGLSITNGVPITKIPQISRKVKQVGELNSFGSCLSSLLSKLSLVPGSTKSQFIQSARRYYKTNLPQLVDRHAFSTYSFPDLYQFMSTSGVHLDRKHRIRKEPEMTLKRLSELTDYPEIVSRSVFQFSTLIATQHITIPYCVISSDMLGIEGKIVETIFIVNDVFDSFIQHITLVKDLLEEGQLGGRRVVLFNWGGQSHTIYGDHFGIQQFAIVMDKLMFKLRSHQEKVRFIGFGFGGSLLQAYVGYNLAVFKDVLSGVLLVNTFKEMGSAQNSPYRDAMSKLLKIYSAEGDPSVELDAYLHYNKAIHSEEVGRGDLEHKSGLNPIRVPGRVFQLQGLLRGVGGDGIFEHVDWCPVWLVLGRRNVFGGTLEMSKWLIGGDGQAIKSRKLVEIEGGHDILAQNYDSVTKHICRFLKSDV